MSRLSINIHFINENEIKKMKFSPSKTIGDIINEISTQSNFDSGGYGLYQNGANRKRWLSVDKTLESYSISTGSTLEFKKKSKTIKVNFPDNSLKTFQVDGNSKFSEVINLICEKLQLINSDEFSLKRENGAHDAWLNLECTVDEIGVGEKDILLFRKRFFASDNYIDTSEPAHLHLLYSQCSEAIKSGELQCSELEGINLTSIQLQINFGDAISQSTKIDISEYLPREFSKIKNIEKRILKKQKFYSGLSQLDAKYEFVKVCRSLKYYGVTFFEATERNGKKEKLVLIGIRRDGIIVIDRLTDNILLQYRFSEIKRYSSGQDRITFDFGDYLNEYITFYTDKADLIVGTIEGYINLLIKKRTTNKTYQSGHKRLNELLYHETFPFDLIQYKVNGINQHEYKIAPLDIYSGSELCKQIIASAQVIFEHMKIQENGLSEDDSKSFGKAEFFSGKHRSFLLKCNIEGDLEALSAIIQHRSMERIDPIIKNMVQKIANMNSAVYNASTLKDSHSIKLHYNISKVTSLFIQLIQVISKLIDENNPSETEVYKLISRLNKSIRSLKKQITPVMTYHTINTSIVLSVQNLLRTITLYESELKENALLDQIISIKNIVAQLSHMLNQLNQFIASRHTKQTLLKMAEEIKQKLEQLKSSNETRELKFDIPILIAEEIEQTIHMISNERFSSPIDETILLCVDIKKIISQLLNPIDPYISEDYFHILSNYLKSFQRLYLAVQNSLDKKHVENFKELTKLILLEKDYFDKLIDDNTISETSLIVLQSKCRLLKYCFTQIITFFGSEPTMKIMRNYLLESIIHFNSITYMTFENRNILYDSTRKRIERIELKCRRQILRYIKHFNAQAEHGVTEELIRDMSEYENIMFTFISTMRYSWLNLDNRNYFNIRRAIEGVENNLENIRCTHDYLIVTYYYIKSMRQIRKISKDKALIEKQAESLHTEPSVRNHISNFFYEFLSSIKQCIQVLRERPDIFMDNFRIMIKNGLKFTENFMTILKTTKDPEKAKKKATKFINYYDLLKSASISLLKLNVSENNISDIKDSIVHSTHLIKCIYSIKCLDRKDNEDISIIAGNLSDILYNFYDIFESRIIVLPIDNNDDNIEDEIDNFIHLIERLETFYSMNHMDRIGKEVFNLSISCADIIFSLSKRMHNDQHSDIDLSEIMKYSYKTLELLSLSTSTTNLSGFLNEFILYLHKAKSILYFNQDSKHQFVHMLTVLSYDMKRLTLRKPANSPNTIFDLLESCTFIHSHISQLILSPQKNNSYILMEIYLKLRDLAATMVSRITSDKILLHCMTIKQVLASIGSISKSKKNELKKKSEYLYEQLELMKESLYKNDHKFKDKFLSDWKRFEKKVMALRQDIDKVLGLNIHEYSSSEDKVITYDHIRKENEMMDVVSSLHQKAKLCRDELNALVNKFIPANIIYELSIQQTNQLISSLSRQLSNKTNQSNMISFKREIDESISKIITLEQHLFNFNHIEPVTTYIQTLDTCIQCAHDGILKQFSVTERLSLNEVIERWIQFIEDEAPLLIPGGGEFLNTFVNSVINASQTFNNNQIELLQNAKKCLLILEQNHSESIYKDLIECLYSFKPLMEMEQDSSLIDPIQTNKEEEEKIEDVEEKMDLSNKNEENEKEKSNKDSVDMDMDSNKMSSNILSDISSKVKSVIGSFLQEIKMTDANNQKDRNEEIRAQWSKKVEEISMIARISKLERKLEQAKMEYPLNQSENVM